MADADQVIGDIRSQIEGRALLEGLAERVGLAFQAGAVFGDPVERDGVTVIPVARSTWGFGGGTGGEGESEGSGGGGGGVITPVGYIEVRNDGAEFKRLRDPATRAVIAVGALALIGLLARHRPRSGRMLLGRRLWES